MIVHPVTLVLAVLAIAALCFALGTFRGSWRVWLVGYALTVVALALALGGVHRAHRGVGTLAPPVPPAPAAPETRR